MHRKEWNGCILKHRSNRVDAVDVTLLCTVIRIGRIRGIIVGERRCLVWNSGTLLIILTDVHKHTHKVLPNCFPIAGRRGIWIVGLIV